MLGRIGGPRAVRALVAALSDDEVSSVANDALRTLGWRPTDAAQRVRQLVYQLEAQSVRHPEAISAQLVQIGSAAVEPLIDALHSGNREVRRTVAQALGAIGDPRAVEPLMLLVSDEKRSIQKGAALVAGLV